MTERQKAREARLDSRCSILAEIIVAIRPVHSKADIQQKAFIETMIGAAIWYVPKPTNAWTGQVSIGALKIFHPDSGHLRPRFSEEHVYPRKVAARLLLENQLLDGAVLSDLFRENYGRLHYVTPDENKAVQRFQRDAVFTRPEDAYSSAGITLIPVTDQDLRLVKKRDRITIDRYLDGHI